MKLFNRKAKNHSEKTDEVKVSSVSHKDYVIYNGCGSPAGDIRVEKIVLRLKDDKCIATVDIGDFTPTGGAGFECEVPEELLNGLSDDKLTDFFNEKLLPWKVQLDQKLNTEELKEALK